MGVDVTQGYTNSLVRQMNEQAVINTVLRHGPISRVAIADRTGLSKPTVSEVMESLVTADLVRPAGRSSGAVGRSAVLYEANRHARHVIGIDLGGTKVRAAVADLFGDILVEELHSTARGGRGAILDQLVGVARNLVDARGLDWRSVTVLSLAAPGVFDRSTDHVTLASNVPGFEEVALTAEIGDALQVDVHIENDVNAAAIGERWRGIGRSCDQFAFLAIGTGFGMGLVLNGELHRGHRGAAGEIAYLPIGRDPFDPAVHGRGALEEAASGSGISGLLARHLASGADSVLPAGASVEEIFDAAARGDELALALVSEEAALVAQAVLAVSSVVDPELFVLGGGIGANPLLLPFVREQVDRITPHPVRVETSALGDRATLIGAISIGLRTIRDNLFQPDGR